jgi:hypothetical protein
MRGLEANDAPLACLAVKIADLSSYLERHAHGPGWAEVSDIYHDAIVIIRGKCSSTANSIFHLASVHTAARRILARDTLLQGMAIEVKFPNLAEAEFDEQMACEGLVSLHDPPLLEDNGHDILEVEEEDGETITPERIFETDRYTTQYIATSGRPLHLEAESGLREIRDQFRLSATEIEEVIGSFQNFIATAPSDLFLKPIPKKNRYAGAISRGSDQIREILSDIAQRLAAVVYNEAVTERTNSAIKRISWPFRLRMQSEVLLSRLTIARHGSVEP